MKWLFRVVLTLAALVGMAVLALLFVPADPVVRLAAERIQQQTGRMLSVEGSVRATLWPRLGVRAEGIALSNADWAGAEPMMTARALEIGLDPMALIRGALAIETLEVEGAVLDLVRRGDGVGNWALPGQGSTGRVTTGETPSRDIRVARAALTDARIAFRDLGSGQDWLLEAVDLAASLPGLDGPLGLTGSALMNGVAFSVEGRVDGPVALAEGALTPVRLALRSGGSEVVLEGRADLDPVSFEGRLRVASDDRLALLRAVGGTPPDLPKGLGRDRLAALSEVTLAPEGSLHLRGLDLTLDGNALSGGLDLVPGEERPRVTATLQADALDLTALSREGQGGESALVTETGWGRETIDVSALFAVDGDLTFTSGPVTLGDATLDAVALSATLDRGRAVASFRPILAYGGEITGEWVVNGRGGLSTRAVLDLTGLQMQPFLTEFADFDRLVGEANLSVNLLGVGDTAQALMDSLDGELAFRVGRGEILGLDLAGMIRTLDLNYRGEGQKTVFDGISGSFAVTDGVMRGEDLAFDAPLLAATGAGEVDLAAQNLDYRLMATLRRNAESAGVTVPVLFQGPWSDLSIRPDLEWLARRELEARAREEAAKIEARVRAEAEEAARRAEQAARERLAAELEVDVESLGSREAIEAAIRDRVGTQLLDALRSR
ncbi:AsmA family protein [Jannaschia seohaensis]|uniref:AsmA protein n=1 Tax=Jannaschia seohaensis TaxID=475081 RepID=A0A2Y9A985_9RHOB|nr:AsmA family protein [Jannaschia seohaensis]PWJ22489.1 AsmA protein [Jannaschia seohaensis]SSA38767.1 AsmA protein [Jannaschia seohaensis]